MMDRLIQYILDLFANPDAARAFVAGPGQAMTDAGLINVAPEEFSSAVASALPGLPLGAGDPIGGLQQVLTDQYGFAPGYGGYDQGYGYDSGYGYDPGYGGYDPGYGYGPGLVGAVAQDAGVLVGDAVAPVVDGAGAVLGLGSAIVADVGGGLLGAVDAGLYGGLGFQTGGWGGYGPGFGPGWGGLHPGWGHGWSDRPGWGHG